MKQDPSLQPRTVFWQDLGKVSYAQAWELQEKLLAENLSEKREASAAARPPQTRHYLLFVEHPPVYTLGKSGKAEHLLLNQGALEEQGIEYVHTNRGGDITFHGPGQIVCYPIFDLEKFQTDIGVYLRNLEEVVIRTLAAFGLQGARSKGETGVWLEPGMIGRERKICAIGVRCSRWITMHGFALNVRTDLSYFNGIIPCGIVGKQVTSLQQELGRAVQEAAVKTEILRQVESVFDVSLEKPEYSLLENA